jgi:hypothetical protein
VPDGKRDHHVLYTQARKASDVQASWQNPAADAMTVFSGSMPFVNLRESAEWHPGLPRMVECASAEASQLGLTMSTGQAALRRHVW